MTAHYNDRESPLGKLYIFQMTTNPLCRSFKAVLAKLEVVKVERERKISFVGACGSRAYRWGILIGSVSVDGMEMKREHWASAEGILKDESKAPQEDEQSGGTTGPASGKWKTLLASIQQWKKRKKEKKEKGDKEWEDKTEGQRKTGKGRENSSVAFCFFTCDIVSQSQCRINIK